MGIILWSGLECISQHTDGSMHGSMQWIPKQIVAICEDFHSHVGDGKVRTTLYNSVQSSLARIRQKGWYWKSHHTSINGKSVLMLAYPCRCVISSHVSPVLSYPLKRTLNRVVFTLPSSTWLWKSPPIPTICSGIHCIEPSFCCANAFQPASKYDVAVRSASNVFPWARLRSVVLVLVLLSDVLGVEIFMLAPTGVRRWR